MERWRVPDAIALELIEFPGKLGKEGKRPRFRFTTRQKRITSYLPEIDAALMAAGKDTCSTEDWWAECVRTGLADGGGGAERRKSFRRAKSDLAATGWVLDSTWANL